MPESVTPHKPEISDKPLSTDVVTKKSKRVRRKPEVTRHGALLPDIIRIGNHVITSRMSNDEFNSKCKNLKAKCTGTKHSGKECNADISK